MGKNARTFFAETKRALYPNHKTVKGDQESLGFTLGLAKPELVKEVGRQSTLSQDNRAIRVRVARRDALENIWMEEDERQPAMVRLANKCRSSNMVTFGNAEDRKPYG